MLCYFRQTDMVRLLMLIKNWWGSATPSSASYIHFQLVQIIYLYLYLNNIIYKHI